MRKSLLASGARQRTTTPWRALLGSILVLWAAGPASAGDVPGGGDLSLVGVAARPPPVEPAAGPGGAGAPGAPPPGGGGPATAASLIEGVETLSGKIAAIVKMNDDGSQIKENVFLQAAERLLKLSLAIQALPEGPQRTRAARAFLALHAQFQLELAPRIESGWPVVKVSDPVRFNLYERTRVRKSAADLFVLEGARVVDAMVPTQDPSTRFDPAVDATGSDLTRILRGLLTPATQRMPTIGVFVPSPGPEESAASSRKEEVFRKSEQAWRWAHDASNRYASTGRLPPDATRSRSGGSAGLPTDGALLLNARRSTRANMEAAWRDAIQSRNAATESFVAGRVSGVLDTLTRTGVSAPAADARSRRRVGYLMGAIDAAQTQRIGSDYVERAAEEARRKALVSDITQVATLPLSTGEPLSQAVGTGIQVAAGAIAAATIDGSSDRWIDAARQELARQRQIENIVSQRLGSDGWAAASGTADHVLFKNTLYDRSAQRVGR